MDALVLSTLLFNGAGIVAIAIAMALAYCLPARRQYRSWVSSDANAAVLPAKVEAALAQVAGTELSHAA